MRNVITYKFMGGVERLEIGSGGRLGVREYGWRDGYAEVTSSGGILYPWVTRGEAKSEARSRGARARFVDSDGRVLS